MSGERDVLQVRELREHPRPRLRGCPAEEATDMEVLEWGRPEQAYKVGEGWRRVHRVARAGVREADQRCLRARCDAAAVHFHVNKHRLAIEEQGKIDLDVGQ